MVTRALAATALVLCFCTSCGNSPPPGGPPPGKPAAPGAAGAAPAGTGAAVAARPTASAMLALMKARYANAKSYRDSGGCFGANTYVKPGTPAPAAARPTPVNQMEFTTAFDRNDGFRWVNTQTNTFDGVPAVYAATSVDLKSFDWTWPFAMLSGKGDTAWDAFSPSLGNTASLCGIVPAMLMPLVDFKHVRFDPTGLKGAADAGDEVIDGVTCYVVDGHGWTDQRVRVWIDSTGALRKFWCQRPMPGAFDLPPTVGESTVTYRPEFDVEISAEELRPAEVPEPSTTPAVPSGR